MPLNQDDRIYLISDKSHVHMIWEFGLICIMPRIPMVLVLAYVLLCTAEWLFFYCSKNEYRVVENYLCIGNHGFDTRNSKY